METGDLMPHSLRLSNNPYSDPNQPIPRINTYFIKIHSNILLHLCLGLPQGLFPVGFPVKI